MEDGRLLRNVKYDNLVKDQVVIAYLSKGGIPISDTDELSPYDRRIVFDTLTELRKLENEAIEEN